MKVIKINKMSCLCCSRVGVLTINEKFQNEVYAELIGWPSQKLYAVFSNDGGKTISNSRIHSFLESFTSPYLKENRLDWDGLILCEHIDEWIELFRSVKRMVIKREAKFM